MTCVNNSISDLAYSFLKSSHCTYRQEYSFPWKSLIINGLFSVIHLIKSVLVSWDNELKHLGLMYNNGQCYVFQVINIPLVFNLLSFCWSLIAQFRMGSFIPLSFYFFRLHLCIFQKLFI